MDELVEFLRARYDEDEAVAQDALNDVVPFHTAIQRLYQGGWHSERSAHHIDRQAPARVLAEVEAKRRIVDHHARIPDLDGDPLGDGCAVCTDVGPDAQGWPCQTLRLLALPFDYHPDHDEAWRPTAE